MKKVLLLVFVTCSISLAATAQISFGVQGGVNFANVGQNFEDSDSEFETKFKVGPRIGVIIDVALADAFSIRPGLFYSSKGYAIDVEEEYQDASSDDFDRYVLNYLEVPINAVYKAGSFELFAGPYLAFGVGGVNKFEFDGEDDEIDIEFKNEVDTDNDDPEKGYARASDFGIQLGVGYNVDPVVISASFSKGLGNLMPDYTGTFAEFFNEDDKASNTVINLSVAFMFN